MSASGESARRLRTRLRDLGEEACARRRRDLSRRAARSAIDYADTAREVLHVLERSTTSTAVRQLSKRIRDWVATGEKEAKVPQDRDELEALVKVWNVWLRRKESTAVSKYLAEWEVATERPPSGKQRATRSSLRASVNTVPEAQETVERPQELDELKRLLLEPHREEATRTVGVTTGVHGAGGFGKTTLAMMLAHDPDVVGHFRDGVLWIVLGQQPTGVVRQINRLVTDLTGLTASYATEATAQAGLEEALAGKNVLLVVDDVWHRTHLDPFRVGGSGTALLATTRQTDALPSGTRTVRVDALTADQSRELLLAGLPLGPHPPNDLLYIRDRVQQATGGWAVLLRLINGLLRSNTDRITDPQEVAAIAIQDLTRIANTLANNGITSLDPSKVQQRDQAIDATMRASLTLLGPDQDRYLELAVFPEDTDIPITVLDRFWSTTARWDPGKTLAFCTRLRTMSLLDSYTRTSNMHQMRLHDVIRKYLRDRTRGRLVHLHTQLLGAHQNLLSSQDAWWELPRDQDYLWSQLGAHLVGAGRADLLAELLGTARYLAAKLDFTGPAGVEGDLALLPLDNETLIGVSRAVRQSGHLLSPLDPPGSLSVTLATRLPPGPRLNELRTELELGVRPRLQMLGPTPDLAHPALQRTLELHEDALTAVVIAPDGTWLATGSDDRTVRIWDPVRGVEQHRLPEHPDAITALAVAPNGTWLVSLSANTAFLWNTASGAELRHLKHDGPVNAVAVSPDGSWLVTASDDESAVIWDATTGQVLHRLPHPDRVTAVTIAPDGTWIATACTDRSARIWAATGKAEELHCLGRHADDITGVAVEPRSRWLVTVSRDTTARIWSRDTGSELHCLDHPDKLVDVSVSADGTLVATASEDLTAHIWDASTGNRLHTLEDHGDEVNGVTFAPDGSWLVTVGDDNVAMTWNLEGQRQHRLIGHSDRISAAAIASDNRWLVTISDDGTARIWEHSPDVDLTPNGPSFQVEGLAVSPAGDWSVTTSDDAYIRDTASGTYLQVLEEHEDLVTAVAVSPDGTWLVTGSDDQTARMWSAVSGRELRCLTAADRVRRIAMAADGQWFATGAENGSVQLWDAKSGQELRHFDAHSEVTALVVAPNGTWLVAGTDSGNVRAWDRESGQEVLALVGIRSSAGGRTYGSLASADAAEDEWTEAGGPGMVTALAVAPDSRWFVFGSENGTSYLCDVEGAARRQRLDSTPFPPFSVTAVAVAPDGRSLATAREDGSVRIWDAATGQQLHQLQGHSAWIGGAAFHTTGTWLATASDDGTARAWDVGTGASLASVRVDAPLTRLAMADDLFICSGGPHAYSFRLVS